MSTERPPSLREVPWCLLTADAAALAEVWTDDAWRRLEDALPSLHWGPCRRPRTSVVLLFGSHGGARGPRRLPRTATRARSDRLTGDPA